MRQNIRKVFDAWIAGKPAKGDAKNTCSTDGRIVYSYAMPIAVRLGPRTVVIVPREDGPSQTTRSQIDAIKRLVEPHCGHDECYPVEMGGAGMRESCRAERIKAGKIPRVIRRSIGRVPNVPTGGSAYQR